MKFKQLPTLKVLLSTCIVILLFSSVTLFAQEQKVSLKGIVTTLDSKPLSYATVTLKNTKYGTVADKEGHFSMNASKGKYTLMISYAGYDAYEQKIELENASALLDTIKIPSNSTQLREVIVADIQKNKFAKRNSMGPSQLPLNNMETPTVYQTVNKDFLQEINATDFNTALNSTPSVISNDGVNGNGQSINMRGFTTPASYRNGLYTNPRTQTEIYNVERIEIMKGPSATLFGGALNSYAGAMSTYGGVVNTITKAPFESFRSEVSYTAGSWGLNRFTADVNTPLNNKGTALARFNTLLTSQNSFQDAGFQKAFGFSVALLFKVSPKTTIKFDGEIYNPKKTLNGYVRNSQLLSNPSMAQFATIYKRSFTSDDLATARNTYFGSVSLEHKFNDNWMATTTYLHGESVEASSNFLVLFYLNENQVARNIRPFDQLRNTTDHIQQNFIGDFKIGQFRNRLVLGANYTYSREMTQNGMFKSGNRLSPFAVYDTVTLDLKSKWEPISLLKSNSIARELTQSTINSVSTSSVYASNVFNMSSNLLFMASLRADYFQSFNSILSGTSAGNASTQFQLSPKFGFVYQPIKDKVTLFANYVNGFTNIPPTLNQDGKNVNFKPEQAFQFETGVKLNLLHDNLNATISYYNIHVKDLVRYVDDFTQVQDGSVKSKGLELELIANPIKGLNIIGGFGYNDNRFVKYDAEIENKRAQWSPKWTANIWASYKLLQSKWKGLGIGLGSQYVDKVYMDNDNVVFIPAYTTLNGTLFYDQAKYRIGLKVDNITNEKYWNFYGQPQRLRAFSVNVAYKF